MPRNQITAGARLHSKNRIKLPYQAGKKKKSDVADTEEENDTFTDQERGTNGSWDSL